MVRLSDLCVPRTGVRDPADRPDEPFKYVDISAVDNRAKRITAPQTVMGKAAPSRARNIIRAGDVLVATTRPNLNAVAMVPGELDDQICSTGFCVLRAGPRIHPGYLFQFVQSPAFVQPLSDLVKGALYPAVNDSQVLALEIPLPPLEEQERIAGLLTEQMGAVERARAAAAQRLAAAESLPAALLREIFEGPQASGWETVPLGELCDFKNGLNFRSDRGAGHGVKIIGVGDFQSHLFVPVASLSEAHPTEPLDDEFLVRKDDFVFVRSNGNPDLVGRAMIVPELHERVTFTGFSIRARPRGHRADPLFLAYYFKSGDFVKRIRGAGRGSNIRNLSQDLLSELETPLPDLPTQRRLAAELTERLAAAEGVIARCREELAAIEALPAALLRQAFGGSSAPDDEEGE